MDRIGFSFFSIPIKQGDLYVIGSKDSVEFKTKYKQMWGKNNYNPLKKRIILEDVLFNEQSPGDGQMLYEIAITSVIEDGNRIKVVGKLEKTVHLQDES